MPRKERTPASLELNRENQRRSRARHRDFINDLQRRVQEYEERDAQASAEMQRVARVVAEENAFLRELLAVKGVERDEIQGFLDARRAQQMVSSRSVEASPVHSHSHSRSQQPSWEQIKFQSPEPVFVKAVDAERQMPGYYGFADDSTSSTGSTLREQSQSRDEMHCSEAASILAQLRGGSDRSAAHAVLGCAEGMNCSIRNTDLLHVMDKLT